MAVRRAEVAADHPYARVASALALAGPVLAAAYAGSPYFDLLVVGAAGILAWEWNRMCGAGVRAGRIANSAPWLAAGLPYIVVPSAALLWLRHDPALGRELVLWLMATVWAADTGAYAAGRLVGGPRLAPSVSPGKTWAGLAGGIASAAGVGVAAALLMSVEAPFALAAAGAAVGLVAQGGDLLESWVKRRLGVKDASRLIPGHGGLFDRVDGLLAAAVALAGWRFIAHRGVVAWP
jgi:phosphatidate cytidylyltransferase